MAARAASRSATRSGFEKNGEWLDASSTTMFFAGGAAYAIAGALDDVEVDAERMRWNLDATAGLALAERVSHLLVEPIGGSEAHELVVGAAARATGRHLRDELLADPRVAPFSTELDAAFDPTTYLGPAAVFVDRALERYAAEVEDWA